MFSGDIERNQELFVSIIIRRQLLLLLVITLALFQVEAEALPDITMSYQVDSVPTFLILKVS